MGDLGRLLGLLHAPLTSGGGTKICGCEGGNWCVSGG